MVGEDLPGHSDQPGQWILGHNVKAAPGNQEGLRNHVLGILSSSAGQREGQDGPDIGPVEGLKLLSFTATHEPVSHVPDK